MRDIADAMILARLFARAVRGRRGGGGDLQCRARDLYKDGLNRALFLPFVDLLRERMEIIALDARMDYRLQKLARAPVYYCPGDVRRDAAIDAAFRA